MIILECNKYYDDIYNTSPPPPSPQQPTSASTTPPESPSTSSTTTSTTSTSTPSSASPPPSPTATLLNELFTAFETATPTSPTTTTTANTATPPSNSTTTTNLPPLWARKFDKATGMYYYWHTVTRVTQWGRPNAPLIDFAASDSFYADDSVFVFQNRAELDSGAITVHRTLLRLGLKMHYEPLGSTDASKTVAMWFSNFSKQAQPTPLPQPILLPPITIGSTTYPAGQVHFCKEQKYLGTIITDDCNDDTDVQQRINAASNVFGALRHILCSSTIHAPAKKTVFLTCVVTVLLYGSENWNGKESNISKISSFFNICIRRMLRISKWRQWKAKMTTKDLHHLFNIKNARFYIDQRALRWLGHIQRMQPHRLPKKLLFAYVPNTTRARGGQSKNYNKRMTGLLRDMAATLPENIASLMREDKVDTSSRATTRSRQSMIKANVNTIEWKANSTKLQTEWLECSTWFHVANNRLLWKQACKEYLSLKTYE